jgi:hypothetical protein
MLFFLFFLSAAYLIIMYMLSLYLTIKNQREVLSIHFSWALWPSSYPRQFKRVYLPIIIIVTVTKSYSVYIKYYSKQGEKIMVLVRIP